MKCFTVSDEITKGIIIESEPVLRIGAEGFCSEVPLCKSLSESFKALREIGEDKQAMTKADIDRNAPLILPEKVEMTRWGRPIVSDIALVHVNTTSPGQLWFEANCYDEEIIPTRYGRRVRRAYKLFPNPGCGVDVVAIGTGANGEPNALLRMLPGSSFRICRDTVDLPPELLVVWPGTKLRLIVPEKHRKFQRREAAKR